MKTHEYQAKQLFTDYGIPIQHFILCQTAQDAVEAYRVLNAPLVVVKAQVMTGGRGKAGGIKLAKDEHEVFEYSQKILNLTIKDFHVEKLIINPAVNIKSEYYVSFVIDRNTKSVKLIMCAEGGIDIEDVAQNTPEKIHQFVIDPFIGVPDYLARKFAFLFFSDILLVNQMVNIIQHLYRLFIEKDASLAEINPLVVTEENELIAVDAKMVFDDNALYRQPEINNLYDPTEEEKTELYAKEKGFSFVHLDGEIGCMVNGAGLAMATMDLIKLYGGNPANFLDIGGSSNPQKVIDALNLLLKDSNVKVVLINIFGGITRCDDVANGLLKAFEKIETKIPIVVRLTGTNELEGRNLLQGSKFKIAQTMSEATRMAVEISKQ
ncbi:ADP-forming succinate--CoA ligase subunit beta [Dysgonomonas sp. HDW5B]|uniref:ADP-forming succinate--CoA ligase subunit beta n=1 Tax=Dysgonomonas sp. HDW5B TaxID=2714927 RepID=UPI00140786A3|nr:ADP-forming succinate--CoA ligase subunit beta [Dysgonomonas sp. HDW5B]QIK55526.1 ADP-forming succinate--CoA ligase subunit beta [Dysgonomonas sp. HDW5B]